MHQPAGRVIDKHQQGALRSAVLEPPVLAAIDLDQFADAFAPRPRLVNLLALLAIAPQPSFDHPLAQCLTTKGDPMILAQLLGRQEPAPGLNRGRAKIPIPLADDRQNRSPQPLRLAPVAAPTASPRDQTSRTRGSVRLQQSKYLTALEPEQLTRRRGRQSPLIQIAQHLQPRKLPIAHQKNRHPQHPPKIPREVSSVIGRRVTF
jgi:hypothetical protein